MKLLKNNVGRPSNDTLRKRKMFYIAVSALVLILIGGTGFTLYRYTVGINGNSKNATKSACVIPYTTSNCKYAKNKTVEKIQRMLNQLGYYKESDGYDGNFGPLTVKAVKKFQKASGLSATGKVDPTTLEELAFLTDTDYFLVKYVKNGGSGTLKSQKGGIQTVIKGISTPISTTTLKKSGKTHVGYTGTTEINGKDYRYGCFDANCVSGKQSRYSVAEIERREDSGELFYDYVYPIGTTLKNTARDGQVVTLKAYYCSSNEKYDQKMSKCVKSATSSGSYNKSGTLTGYNATCVGCTGYTACRTKAGNDYKVTSTSTYTDSEYGTVRIVAMSTDYKCGTIIEIKSVRDGSTKNAVKAVVMDRGGAIKGNKIDLLSPKSSKNINKDIGKQSVKFKVLRNGW